MDVLATAGTCTVTGECVGSGCTQDDAKAAAKLECAPYGTTLAWGYVSKWFKDPTSVIRYVNSLGDLPSRPQQFASEGGAMAKVLSG